MRITFLGHQGWHFELDGRGFLLDPILECMGNGATRLPVWPRRRLDLGRFEPLDAVIISHEHADHFSLETLTALPRCLRVLIPDLASSAMSTVLADLGFKVERFNALRTFTVAGIRVTALPGLYNTLEPDTYALLMQDTSGASFLTAIDTVTHPDVCTWLAQHCPVRTLDNLTNNFVEPRAPLVERTGANLRSRSAVAANMLEFVDRFVPRRAVVSGQGWSFEGDKSHLNYAFFSVDNEWLTGAARELVPHVTWFDGTPGMRFTLRGEDLAVDQSNLVTVGARASREFQPESVHVAEPYAPWTGRREVTAEEWRTIHDFLCDRYGQILGAYAPRLMEKLYYLKFSGTSGAQPTLAIIVRNGAQRHVFELDYGQLVLREAAALQQSHVVGLEIWAADLALMLGAGEEVFMVYESSIRPWSLVPDIEPSALIEAFMWFTPRFRPQEFLAFYRAQIAALTVTTRSMSA